MKNKNVILIALIVAFILTVPFVAMQFTDEVNWSLSDFVIAGSILFCTGLAFELIARKYGTFAYKVAVGASLLSILFFVWANMAVGLIGSGPNAANLMYLGVLSVGIIEIVIARFTPNGMKRAMFAMTIAMVLAAGIQMIAGMYKYPQSSLVEVLMVNGFFAGLFAGSGLLFQKVRDTKSA